MELQTFIDNSTPRVDMEILNKIVQAAINLEDKLCDETGGYLAICDFHKIPVIVVVPVGEFPKEREYKLMRYACEKVTRVLTDNIIRSYQTRNEKEKRFGGGVRFANHAVSFSGFSNELIDEAISVVYATDYMFDIAFVDKSKDPQSIIKAVISFQIATSNDNPFCIPLAEAVFGEQK